MHQIRFIFSILVAATAVTNCAKKAPDSGTSRVSFQLPANFMSGKLSTKAFSGSACFAVSISGDGLPSASPGDCDSTYGEFGGLAPLGQSIEIETTFGSNRTIDIYYVNSNNGCQAFDPEQGLGQTYGSDKVWLISSISGIDFDRPEVVVEAPIEFPKASNSLATLMQSPTSCLSAPDTINPMNITQARAVQGSTSLLPNGVGTTQNGSRMRVRVYDQKLDMQNPNNFSGRIVPVRLGEE